MPGLKTQCYKSDVAQLATLVECSNYIVVSTLSSGKTGGCTAKCANNILRHYEIDAKSKATALYNKGLIRISILNVGVNLGVSCMLVFRRAYSSC